MIPAKKILVVVLDGLGDRACGQLRGLSPLQFIRTPNLDWFVSHGINGTCDPIAPGVRAGSDIAHLAILGYDPLATYTGRGAFEAIGAGMDIQPGDVAFRCNFATVHDDGTIVDRRAGRIRPPETEQLAELVDGIEIDGVVCNVRASTEYRAALVLNGDGLSPHVSDIDTPAGSCIEPCRPLDESDEAEFTAHIVNSFLEEARSRLKGSVINRKRIASGLLPADMLLPRGPSGFPSIEQFPEKHSMKATCVAAVGVVKGVCGVCGLDIYPLPGACDGSLDSDLSSKMRSALDALEEYDFVLVNIKAGDVAGHMGDVKAKAEVIKRIDAAMGIVRGGMPSDLVVAITCDHCTPCSLMDHSGDSVPVTFYTEGLIRDDATEFSEIGCARGMVGRIRSSDIVPICLDLSNRVSKIGSRSEHHKHHQRSPSGHRVRSCGGIPRRFHRISELSAMGDPSDVRVFHGHAAPMSARPSCKQIFRVSFDQRLLPDRGQRQKIGDAHQRVVSLGQVGHPDHGRFQYGQHLGRVGGIFRRIRMEQPQDRA